MAILSDFGIAKDLADPDRENQLYPEGEILGTPDYVSPEQLLEAQVSPQSDIYSVGAVLYEILTGEKPFPDVPLVGIIQNHLNAPFPLASSTMPDLPAEIDGVIQRLRPKIRMIVIVISWQWPMHFAQAMHGRLRDHSRSLSVSTALDDGDSSIPIRVCAHFQEADA